MSEIYCIKEKRKTEVIDPTYFRSLDNRFMLKAKCGSCRIIKTKFCERKRKRKIRYP